MNQRSKEECTITVTIHNCHAATKHIFRKCTAGYKLSGSQEKINLLVYMDDINLFAKDEKELETLIHTVRIYHQSIGIWNGKMCHACNEKCQKTSDWRSGTTKSRQD